MTGALGRYRSTMTRHSPLLLGTTRLVSPIASNVWRVENQGRVVAVARRHPRLHTSTVETEGGGAYRLTPLEASVVAALDPDGTELGRITRRSWWGRSWDITSQQFAYELISHPRPRRWMFAVGGSPVAELSGSLFSYNRVIVETNLGVPLPAVLLAWHVIARPWEAAAEPGGLVPARRPTPTS